MHHTAHMQPLLLYIHIFTTVQRWQRRWAGVELRCVVTLLNVQYVAVDECLSAFQCRLLWAVLLHLLLQAPGCHLVTVELLDWLLLVMDSLATEQMAPRCTGKQLQFPHNGFVWCVCLRAPFIHLALTLDREHLFSACLICLINFFFTSARSFSSKQFKAEKVLIQQPWKKICINNTKRKAEIAAVFAHSGIYT